MGSVRSCGARAAKVMFDLGSLVDVVTTWLVVGTLIKAVTEPMSVSAQVKPGLTQPPAPVKPVVVAWLPAPVKPVLTAWLPAPVKPVLTVTKHCVSLLLTLFPPVGAGTVSSSIAAKCLKMTKSLTVFVVMVS